MMRVPSFVLAALAALLPFSATVFSGAAQADEPLRLAQMGGSSVVGKTHPGFSLPDLAGKTRDAAEWKGQVLVVNFWATWCAPCKKEIPAFNKIQAEYAADGVQFIGIALDDDKAVNRFKQLIPIDYPVLIADLEAVKLSQDYGNAAGVLPYTVFVDRKGRIAATAAGGLTEEVTRESIEKLL